MKKLSLLLFLIFLNTFGQQQIENKLTDAYQNIKGTKVSLVPPDGFNGASNFQGFQQNESGATIMLLDIPGPYAMVSKGVTKETMLSKGVEVSSIENLTINGLPALFLTGTQNAYGNVYTKYILVFGSDFETIMINGAVPQNLQQIAQNVKKSILTVYYEAGKKVDPLDAIDFKLDVSKTKLKFAKSVSGSLIYTVDGELPTKSTDKTDLIAGKSFSKVNAQDKKLLAMNRIKQMPLNVENIEFTNEITIDGISGYEISASGINKETGKQESIYQVMLFSDNLYYMLLGTTNDVTPKSINEIKTAIRTFKRK